MGNSPSSRVPAGGSCTSGIEGSKADILTTVTSQEELQEYARTQSMLELAKTAEEASEATSQQQMSSSNLDHGPSRRKKHSKKHVSLRGVRHKGHKIVDKIIHAIGHKLHAVEEFMFPHVPQLGRRNSSRHAPAVAVVPKVRGGVLLRGCHTDDEHKARVREVLELLRPLKGKAGLEAVGLEFRLVAIHGKDDTGAPQAPARTDDNATKQNEAIETPLDPANENNHDSETEKFVDPTKMATRLFHAKSNTMITMQNRNEFIADGDMYDAIARVSQEYAQDVMLTEGQLEWVTVCEAGNNPEPIRALVSKAISDDDSLLDKAPTLLIATGKGKVRAGVFSRQHLLMSGMECSTAVPIVREARKRKMNVVMLDPNVHGDRLGMVTFEKSMAKLFRRWEQDEDTSSSSSHPPLAQRDLFVLSHSQSGAQFARYLLGKSKHYVPHIRAVAFTDSTHNIQWARENNDLHRLLESDSCVYFKCSKRDGDSLSVLDSVGTEVDTDHFWQHRFGRIRTRCAGTTEHSLTNWFARSHIWDHFDAYLSPTTTTATTDAPTETNVRNERKRVSRIMEL